MERIDLLRFIHKALRHALLSVNLESGRVDYADTESFERLDTAWRLLGENLGHHARHEDEIIFPLLDARAPGETEVLRGEHERIHVLEADMDGLLDRLDAETGAGLRRLLGAEFHRAVQRYTAVCLAHFDAEERHLMPRLWALFDDDAVEETFGRIMSTIEPAERDYTMTHMVEALDPSELDALRHRMELAPAST